MIEDARMIQMWFTASNHRHGEGIEHGLDFTVPHRKSNSHIKHGKKPHAGALMAIFTGALWSGEGCDHRIPK
eukprot:6562222-Karenia_brevis.AAC.1